MKHFFILFAAVLLSSVLGAADYYVSPSGSDRAPGTEKAPFATFAKGLSVLKAGDTLIMAPGDYEGAGSRKLVGTREKPIVIRAEIPGTVVIRGDKEVKGFKRLPGERFVYEISWKDFAGGVKERDTLTYYSPAGALELLSNSRAAWFHDAKKGKLYVVTSDGRSPDEHLLTVSSRDPKEGHGLQLRDKSQYVHIDGLNFTGFDSYVIKWGRNFYSIKSLQMNLSSNLKVTNCRFFLNGCGLTFRECKNVLAENCTAYANGSLAIGSAANIYFTRESINCTVRNCTAFKSHLSGIRFYSGKFTGSVIERCVSWGHGMSDIEFKGPDKNAVIRESIALKNATNHNTLNNITNANTYRLTPADDPTTLYMRKMGVESQLNDNLADFDNFDGRPMSDSKFKRGIPPNGKVFFLSPAGNDANSGTTIRAPRKSFKDIPDGATVYLMPGNYGKLVVSGKNLTIAGRGRYTRTCIAALEVKGSDVTLRKINFMGNVSGSGKNVKFENCSFAKDLTFNKAQDFIVTHCAFVKGSIKSVNSTGAVFSNILSSAVSGKGIYCDNNAYPSAVPAGEKRSIVRKALFNAPAKGDFTLKNAEAFAGYALDAMPIGPYNRIPGVPGKGIQYAVVHRVTPDSAEINWYLPTGRENCSVTVKSSGEKSRTLSVPGGTLRTITVTGLKPGKAYNCHVSCSQTLDERFLNAALTAAEERRLRRAGSNVELKFTTPLVKKAPQEFFVSVNGSDKAPGTRTAPFRTISHALDVVSPGDTITLREGSYCENLLFKVSDITLRGMEGEKVWLDGKRKLLNFITFHNLRNITIDNLRMRGVITTKKEYIRAVNSSNIKLSRLFFDGRWADGYAPTPLYILLCSNVLVENCVTMSSFRGLHFIQSDDVTVKNCVLSMNSLNQIHLDSFLKNFKLTVTNNIICDTVPVKFPNALIHTLHDHPGLRVENNCFYVRSVPEKRNFVGTWYGAGSGFHPLSHYRKAHPGKETNIFKDPRMPGIKLHKMPCSQEVARKEYRAAADGKSWENLDFKDFFPADAEIRSRKMGLRESEIR